MLGYETGIPGFTDEVFDATSLHLLAFVGKLKSNALQSCFDTCVQLMY